MGMKIGLPEILLFTTYGSGLLVYGAQTETKHSTDFKLAISTPVDTFRAGTKLANIEVDLTETNVSSHIVSVARTAEPGEWYKMVVNLDGRSAPITEEYRQVLHP
jgi:hypothetical protein